MWCVNFFQWAWLRANIKRCLPCCNPSAVRWFSTSHPPWITSSAASSRLAFFGGVFPLNWHRVTLQRINAFPARRQMCSLGTEWSTNHGDCQRELGGAGSASAWSGGCSFCLNTRPYTEAQRHHLTSYSHLHSEHERVTSKVWWCRPRGVTLLSGIVTQVAAFNLFLCYLVCSDHDKTKPCANMTSIVKANLTANQSKHGLVRNCTNSCHDRDALTSELSKWVKSHLCSNSHN